LLILAARVFGSAFGFLLGALGMLASALFTGGVGPWLTYQIFAAGVIGLLAGAFAKELRGWREQIFLLFISIVAAFGYGLLWICSSGPGRSVPIPNFHLFQVVIYKLICAAL